ncbi:hypothetical protein [Corynebacterium sp. A21]|uniref:hypothetical protein n=1 Tax=Corynebacterium sp. A21 TaxID=3457318 RepID=UPI003FD59F56
MRTFGKVSAALLSAGALLTLTIAATPSATAISVDIEDEKCTFGVSESDVLSTIHAELALRQAISDQVHSKYPELSDQISYLQQQVQSRPQYAARVPTSGYLGRTYQEINDRGIENGFHDGELPQSIVDAAAIPSLEQEIDSRIIGIPLDTHGEWNRSDTELFLNFQPKTAEDLAAYWPARVPGASESLLALQVSAAEDIDYLDHLLSVNAAYQACAWGIAGEFPVLDLGVSYVPSSTTAVPVPVGSTKVLAAPAPDLASGEVAESLPPLTTENQWSSKSTSLITLVIAVLVGLMVVFLPYRRR